MKIFILNPCLYTGKLSKRQRKRQPLDLGYLAALLRQNYEVKLLDANALDLSLEETIAEINKFNPEVLVLTSTPIDHWQAPSHDHVKVLAANMVKTVNSISVPNIILTGTHGSITPEWVLKKMKVNFVVRGEPEYTVLNLVSALAKGNDWSGLKGISYLKAEKVINNPSAERIQNLDELPLPAYDLLPMEKYRYTFSDIPTPFSIILSSRGCPNRCVYCLQVMMPGRYIVRSPENVVAEIKYLVEKFGVKGIYFQDWEFMIIKERVKKICDLIIAEKIKIKWGCNGRAVNIDDELVAKMKQAGCVRVNIGFESGADAVLQTIKKNVSPQALKNAFAVCKKYGINIGVYSLLNLPGETKKTISETEKFLVDNDLQVMCSTNFPIPYFGTEMYEMLKKQEGRQSFDWEKLDKYAGKVGVSQPPWLAKIYRWHYKYKYTLGRWYFLKPKFYAKFIKLIKSRIYFH
ncbi:MAG: radical SAM protein [Patescibacteria group bacterium]|jgi:radical SAM superfamily enzyme YgiQ (UPF0313 family)